MSHKDHGKGYTFAFVSGLLIGGLATIFLSAKTSTKTKNMVKNKVNHVRLLLTDPETQARAQESFGEQFGDLKDAYELSVKRLQNNLKQAENSMNELSESRYIEAVREATQYVKNERDIPTRQIDKIRKYLESDFLALKTHLNQQDNT